MRVLFLVPLLGLTLGPRTVVSNTITAYTVTEVEEDPGATDAGDGDVGVWPGNSDVVDGDGKMANFRVESSICEAKAVCRS